MFSGGSKLIIGKKRVNEASLFDSPFSISLIAMHILVSVFTESFLFDILKSTVEKEGLKKTCFCANLIDQKIISKN